MAEELNKCEMDYLFHRMPQWRECPCVNCKRLKAFSAGLRGGVEGLHYLDSLLRHYREFVSEGRRT